MTIRRTFTTGFEEYGRLLNMLPGRVENKILARAAKESIQPGFQAVRGAAPISKKRSAASKKYGRLKSKIRARAAKFRSKGMRAAEVHTGKAFYSTFYELGTRRQPARPFVAKAFFSAEQKMIDILKRVIGGGIVDEVTRLRGRP